MIGTSSIFLDFSYTTVEVFVKKIWKTEEKLKAK